MSKAVHKVEIKSTKKFAMPVALNVIMLALGICLLIWADKVTKLISIAIGAMFLLYAFYNFISYAKIEKHSNSDVTKLISGVILSIAGAFLIIQNDFLKEALSIVVGLFILIESLFRMQDALQSKAYNPNYKNSLTLAVIGVICGALCLFGKIIVPDLMVQALGIILIIFAFVDMTGGVMVTKSAKKVSSKVID